MSTEIGITMFWLFPGKSFTDFQGIQFFTSRFWVIPFTFHKLTLMLPSALGNQNKTHTSKNIWLAGSGGRFLFFTDSVQLAQRLAGHRCARLAEKSRVSLFESSELGSKAQLTVMTSPAAPMPVGHPTGQHIWLLPWGQQSVSHSVIFLNKGSSVFCSICSVIQGFLF